MTKRIILIATAIAFASLTYAVDFGAELSNEGGVRKGEETDFLAEHSLALWLTTPIGSGGTTLSVEGRAVAEKEATADEYELWADVNLFRFSMALNARFGLDAGRMPMNDVTGLVLAQPMDGAELHGTFEFGNLDASVGYTGFLNVRAVDVLMTADDAADDAEDGVYALGAKRLVAKVSALFPELFGSVDLAVEGIGQYDLRGVIGEDGTQTAHTGYVTASLSGELTDGLFWRVSATAEMGVLDDGTDTYSITSGVAVARLDYYRGAKLHVSADCLYSPGNDSTFTEFVPISFRSAGNLYEPGYGNLIRPSLSAVYAFADTLNVDASCAAFLHPKKVAGADGMYSATEISIGATALVFSDLRFRLSTDLLLPSGEDVIVQASLTAIVDL